MTPIEFVEALKALTFENTFNPYSDQCPTFDREGAAHHRYGVLLSILESAIDSEIDSLWIGRDLGYRGGRRTGLALTDEVHMTVHASRWGVSTERVTKGEVVAERTAAVTWDMLQQMDTCIFLWNVFPLHPHQPNKPFTNRSHNARERYIGEELLLELIHLLEPCRLVPIGNDAAISARRLDGKKPIFQVRHPSYGGRDEFVKQVSELYDLGH